MELICKREDTILKVDEEWLIKRYLDWCKVGSPYSNAFEKRNKIEIISLFVDDYWSGLDDCYYYCTNVRENQQKLVEFLFKKIKDTF